MVDISKLEDGLSKFTGRDFQNADKACRVAGNVTPFLTTTPEFQSRLAARALNMNPNDITDLPIKEYNRILLTVTNFLFGTLDENVEIQSD